MRKKSGLERNLTIATDECVDGYYDPTGANLWRVDWKAQGFDYCCVYVIGPHKKWPIKVGVSVSPAKRLVAMQTAIWEPLKVHALFFAQSVNDARRVERRVHDDLERQGKALLGEWFDTRPNEASDAIEFAALGEGVQIAKEPWCGRDHPVMREFAGRMMGLLNQARINTADERWKANGKAGLR